MTTSWKQFEHEAGDFAAFVRSRIEAHGLGLLATLRADGSPRISGIEPVFAGEHLWLAMMPRSAKGADLRRDGRFALHNATADKDVSEGDVKINGVAREVTDADQLATFAAALGSQTGHQPQDFELFRVDLTGVASVRPEGDQLAIRSWRPGQPVRTRHRS